MHLLNAGFNLVSYFFDKSNQLELLADETACYNKIVEDLLDFCAERVDHPLNRPNQNGNRKIYALIFRQSESWTELQKLFDVLKSKGVGPDALAWASNWRQRIGLMKDLQSTRKNQTEELESCRKNLKKLDLSQGDLVYNQARVKLLEAEICNIEKNIQKLLAEGEDEKNENLRNTKLMESEDCKHIIELLNKNWLSLCVFFDFPEISLDEKKLVVQIQSPSEEITTNEANLKKHLNLSTKAIFLIQEKLQVTPVQYHGVPPGKLIRPIEVNVEKALFAESPLPSKRSTSSELTNDIFFGLEFVGENKREKDNNMTSMADKLQQIVKLALKAVNKKISHPES